MEITVIWTESAIEELHHIYDYFYYEVSKKVADKIVKSIVDKTLLLEKNPFIGQKETFISFHDKEIRYLVDGNYKIVYWIKEKIVFIATIFDCRQNPLKMKI